MGDNLTAKRKEELLGLESRLGVSFDDITLLHRALIHSSYANEAKEKNIVHNERLEFLGDAVLELASSTYLYMHFPQMPEGQLTKTRASIVCSTSLAELARTLHLGDYLLLGHGEEMSGGRDRQTNLEDVFEAVIGAIYLDQGWETARDYVVRQLMPLFKQVEQGAILKDYKTILQELVYQDASQNVSYEMVGTSGPDHDKTFTFNVLITGRVMGTGTGRSKKDAEQKAARQALEKLQGQKK
ncbi:ribonuclease III [Selenomonas sp. AE3005]|uniref:ribonuclease III n=1 Tax=Selenomonas sp. AE3005 TaxID=1485543 RepID=UPI001B6B7AD0|nr:ribonuclease III [Selenomonas sp. AE3005]MBP3780376.1 ribonuclease III [Selenomonas sp.]